MTLSFFWPLIYDWLSPAGPFSWSINTSWYSCLCSSHLSFISSLLPLFCCVFSVAHFQCQGDLSDSPRAFRKGWCLCCVLSPPPAPSLSHFHLFWSTLSLFLFYLKTFGVYFWTFSSWLRGCVVQFELLSCFPSCLDSHLKRDSNVGGESRWIVAPLREISSQSCVCCHPVLSTCFQSSSLNCSHTHSCPSPW